MRRLMSRQQLPSFESQCPGGIGAEGEGCLAIACAMAGECTYFLTTDDEILRRGKDVRGITVLDPTAFVREMNL